MGERKGVNKYYPPDFDPSKGGLNKWLGTHPLRDRARKLHQGILVIRFEMPYNIWCGGCGNHIGMGVRYNAEKSKVGNYYTTPIYKFRMKCHLCDNHFEIQTDPKNHDYVILEGARRKEQRWDPRENEQIVPEDKATQKKMATDPMYKLEHGSDDKQRGNVTQMSVAQIEEKREAWMDDYMLNKMARNKFREEKKQIALTKAADQALLNKSSLDIDLVPEHESDHKLASLMKFAVTASFDENQQKKRQAIADRPLFAPSTTPSCSLTPKSGSLSKRMLTKHKLGLHLSSPKVEHAMSTPSLKGLVKNGPKTPSSTVSTRDKEDCERLIDPSIKGLVKNVSKTSSTVSSYNEHRSHSFNQSPSDDPSTVSSISQQICKDQNHMTDTISAERTNEDSFVESERTDSGAMHKLDTSCDGENAPGRESSKEDTTALATLMASYPDSESSNSDDENT